MLGEDVSPAGPMFRYPPEESSARACAMRLHANSPVAW